MTFWLKSFVNQLFLFFSIFRKKNIFLRTWKINEIFFRLFFQLCGMQKPQISKIYIISSYEHITRLFQKFDGILIHLKKQSQSRFFWNSWKINVTFDIRYIIVSSISITKNNMIMKIINHFFFISNVRNTKLMINHSRNLSKISKRKKKRIRQTFRQTQARNERLRKLRRYEKIGLLWKSTTPKEKTTQNIKIEKNQHISLIKTNDTRSKKNWNRQNRYQNKNRYQNNRQNNFQNNFRHKNRPREQETYTNNYEHGSFYDFESYEKIDSNEKYDENDSDIQYSYNLISKFFGICRKCEISKENFVSNNSFHVHIHVCKNQSVKMTISSFVKISNFSVIEFSVFIIVNNELEFRNYRYVTVWIIVALQTSVEIVIDNKCAVFLIDEIYFWQILSAKKFIKMIVFINVRSIENAFRENDFYLFLNLYLNEVFRKSPTREYFRKKMHIVNDLKCKVFLNMNILKTKQMTLNMKNKIMILFICKNLIVFIRIVSKSNARIWRVIHFKNQTVILVKAVAQIFIYLKKKRFSDDRNYLFESDQKQLAVVLNEIRLAVG